MLIRVKAFGLNRSEMFTRQGHSPTVKFPRILGIEASGVIEEAPGNEDKFTKGDVVATAMGGMGREFDGGYAEYTVVPASQVQVVKSAGKISWEMLGALPEMMQTTWGALFKALRLQKNDRLLIRGGTTSVGLAAAAIAESHGAFVAATTRKPEREQLLRANGAEQVFIDNGTIADQVKQTEGFNKVLEMVGVTTLRDSLQCVEEGGTVCMVGSVSGKWAFDDEFSSVLWCRFRQRLVLPLTIAVQRLSSRLRWMRLSISLGRRKSKPWLERSSSVLTRSMRRTGVWMRIEQAARL